MTFISPFKEDKNVLKNIRISTFSRELWPVDEAFRKTRSKPAGGRLSAPSDRRKENPTVLTWEELDTFPECIFGVDNGQEIFFTLVPDGRVSHQLDLDALLVKRRSSKLLVVLHGALDRGKYILPRMEFRTTLEKFDGSVLFIADPTLYVHEQLTLGWYVGSQVDNGHAMVEFLVRQAVKSLEPRQLVIAGSSGGGFAALAVSARIPESSALVFSPQTSIEKYNLNHRRRFISSAFPDIIPGFESLSAFEERLDMGSLYRKGTNNRVFYLQNTGDPMHMKNHCIPFMRHVGLDLLNGEMRNKRMKVECRFLREGHGGPKPKQLLLYVNRVFDGGF